MQSRFVKFIKILTILYFFAVILFNYVLIVRGQPGGIYWGILGILIIWPFELLLILIFFALFATYLIAQKKYRQSLTTQKTSIKN